MKEIVKFQFGHCYSHKLPGYIIVGRTYQNPCFLWTSEVVVGANMNCDNVAMQGFITSAEAKEFWIGLPDGNYRINVMSYESLKDHGPFSIKVSDVTVISDVLIKAGKIWKESFDVTSSDGVIRLEFLPSAGKDFVISTMVVEGTEDAELKPIFKTAPPSTLPNREELAKQKSDQPENMLRKICDWFVENRHPDGFLGDFEGANTGIWYSCAMPLRALLAGYDILGEKAYLDVSLELLDMFIGEQLPNGAFSGLVRRTPTNELSLSELEKIHSVWPHARLPLSDIGSVVSAVAIASKYADPIRQRKYIDTVCRFCDGWAIKFQQDNGGFSDGRNDDKNRTMLTEIYTCATAIEAATFSLAYAIADNYQYEKVARNALNFLLKHWHKSGRMIGEGQPHWTIRNRKPFLMEPLYFGDMWYYDEGFITAGYHCQDEALVRRINEAMCWRVFGDEGLLSVLNGDVWWPIQDIWLNAKSLGMPQTLLYVKSVGKSTPELEQILTRMRKFLCTPEYCRRLGVMVDDTERPTSEYGVQTWSGCIMESTGFAGMTLAEMIQPGVLYLATNKQKKLVPLRDCVTSL